MIRLLGCIFVLGACLWIGAYFAMKEKYRLQELEELERGMLYLQGQIQYLSAPLAEAMEGIGWRTGGELGCIFQEVAERLSGRTEVSAEKVWQEVWQEKGKKTFFNAEDLDAVFLFGRSLGYLDKVRQEHSIGLLLRYLEYACGQGRKRMEKNGRLYYGMGGLCGLLIVVTLL